MLIRSVRDILGDRELPLVTRDMTIRAAAEVLDHFNVGAVVVLDGERLVGILSERDIIRRCIAQGADPVTSLVTEAMTPAPATVAANDGVAEAFARMTDGHFRHLPVMEGTRCIGLLSVRDVPTEYRMMHERFQEMRRGN
jgi:CBS domain-containing protein